MQLFHLKSIPVRVILREDADPSWSWARSCVPEPLPAFAPRYSIRIHVLVRLADLKRHGAAVALPSFHFAHSLHCSTVLANSGSRILSLVRLQARIAVV